MTEHQGSDMCLSSSHAMQAQGLANEDSSTATSPLNSSAVDGPNDLLASEKEDTKVRINSVCGSQATSAPTTKGRPWKLTIIRFGPLSGLFCLCLAAASIVAAFGVLIGSRNALVKSWKVEPSAYLAICTAIANQSMRYAAFHGVAIAWWLGATTRGSTLAKLHYDWRSGTTIRGALTAGRHMGLLGLACIFSTLVAIDGPLLQRASTVVLSPVVGSVDLQVTMAMEVPTGFTGGWSRSGSGDVTARISDSFNDTIPAANGTTSNHLISQAIVDLNGEWGGKWIIDGTMDKFIKGCPHTCKATIRAPALAPIYCSSTIIPVDYLRPVNLTTELSEKLAPPLSTDAFIISHSLQVDEYESINLVTARTTNVNCSGTLNYTACNLVSAIGEYDVLIKNNTVSLTSLPEPRIVSLANNTRVKSYDDQRQNHPSTLAGISFLGSLKWDSGVSMFTEDGSWAALSALEYGNGAFMTYRRGNPDVYCWNFTDPREDVMRSLNKLMFVTGWWAPSVWVPAVSNLQSDFPNLKDTMDPGLPINVTITGEQVGEENRFHVDFAWFFGAVAVELLCIALVLPTYWGWWRLGRPVSFSPLEIAKAFEAPLLSDCNSNSSGRDIAKVAGNVEVQYGATNGNMLYGKETDSSVTKLAFGRHGFVNPPTKDTHFEV